MVTTRQLWLLIIVFILFACAITWLLHLALGHENSAIMAAGSPSPSNPPPNTKHSDVIIEGLVGLLIATLVAAFGFAFDPFKSVIRTFLSQDGNRITILTFGFSGSGKSELIKHVTSREPLKPRGSSPKFRITDAEYPISSERKVDIRAGDYRGQKPSQVTSNLPDEFAGPRGRRRIHSLLVLVDLIGRRYKDQNDDENTRDENMNDEDRPVLDDNELLKWLAANPAELEKRIDKQIREMSQSIFEAVFGAIESPYLTEVHFLVTKLDFYRKAISLNLIADIGAAQLEAYALGKFSQVQQDLMGACNAVNSRRNKDDSPPINFSARVISVRDDSADIFFYDLINRLSGRRK